MKTLLLSCTLIASSILTGCVVPSDPAETGRAPKRWKEPGASELAARVVAADASALAGDRDGYRKNMQAAQDHLRNSMKMADPTKPIDRELARAAAKRVEAVRSAVWLDRDNLFVIVKQNEQRSQATIDRICMELEPLGDTLAVVVNVQSGAATSGDDLEILSRNCQLEPGDRAFLQRNRQVDALSPEARAQHKANNGR
jgi:hypothetical protein